MRLFSVLLWKKATREPVPFQELLPLKLRPTVSGKGDKNSDVSCIQEMSVMLSCLKQNEYNESMCPKEIEGFKKCYANNLKETRQRKEHAEKGILSPGEKKLTSRQVNILLKKHPNFK